MKKYVFVIDGEVGPDLIFEDQGVGEKFEANRALAAALSSNPTVVEIPIDSPVKPGWTWDGTNFKEPSN